MVESDTIKLLRECDAGIKMGMKSIDDVLDNVDSDTLRGILGEAKNDHVSLQSDLRCVLQQYEDEGKEPSPVAEGMSWVKTNVKLGLNESDATIADLMTEGCNMGVKSLCRYLNQYQAADEESKGITRRIIEVEERLAEDIRPYL